MLALAALAAPFDSSRGTEPAESEIRSAIESWRSAFNNRDEEHVCDFFTPDVVANYQGEAARDYTSLCEMLHSALRDPETRYRYSMQIKEVVVYGASAIVSIVWALEIEKAGNPKETIEEPAVDMLRRQADGAWKISRYLAYSASR